MCRGGVALVACLLVLATASCDMEMNHFSKIRYSIIGTGNSLAEKYICRCVTILHVNKEIQTWQEARQIYLLFKELGMNVASSRTVLAESFSRHLKTASTEGRCSKTLFLIFGWQKNVKQELQQFSDKVSWMESVWLIFLKSNFSSEQMLQDVNVPADGNIIVAKPEEDGRVTMEEAYRVAQGYPLRISHFGCWDGSKLETPSSYFLQRRSDLEGHPVRATTKDDYPISKLERGENGQLIIQGYFGFIYYELAKAMNFTPVYVETLENVTGSVGSLGQADGLLGMAQRNETDLAVGPMTITHASAKIVNFVRPLLVTNHQIFFKQDGTYAEWSSIFKPFRLEIWLMVIVWLLVNTTFMSAFYNIAHASGRESDNDRGDFNVVNSFFAFLQAFCQQGNTVVPTSVPCRILYYMGYLISTVLVTSYSASLISHLTTTEPARPFDSLQTLYDDGSYTLIAIAHSSEYSYFANSNQLLEQKIYNKMMKHVPEEELPNGKEEGIQQICFKKKHALFISFIVTQITAKQYAQEKGCKILHFRTPLTRVSISIAVRKNFPFSRLLDFNLKRMKYSGILQKLQKQAWPLDSKHQQVLFAEVSIQEMFPIHFILFAGMVLATLVLLLEMERRSRWHEFEKRRDRVKKRPSKMPL